MKRFPEVLKKSYMWADHIPALPWCTWKGVGIYILLTKNIFKWLVFPLIISYNTPEINTTTLFLFYPKVTGSFTVFSCQKTFECVMKWYVGGQFYTDYSLLWWGFRSGLKDSRGTNYTHSPSCSPYVTNLILNAAGLTINAILWISQQSSVQCIWQALLALSPSPNVSNL